MEVRELLHPEEYDPANDRYFHSPDMADRDDLFNIVVAHFEIDQDVLAEFVDYGIFSKVYCIWPEWDKMDLTIQRANESKANLYKIRQALDHIEQYSNIEFKIELSGNKKIPEIINIIDSDIIKQFFEVLKRKTRSIKNPPIIEKKSGRKPRYISRSFRNEFALQAFSFIDKHCSHLNITEKKYFAGLILVIIGILNPECKYDDNKYTNYRDYLIKKVNQYLNVKT